MLGFCNLHSHDFFGFCARLLNQLRNFSLVPSQNSAQSGTQWPALLSAYSDTRLSLKALPITDTELKLIAAAAIIGLNSKPKRLAASRSSSFSPIESTGATVTNFGLPSVSVPVL